MTLPRCFRERIGDTGLSAQRRIFGDADLLGNGVRGEKADTANVVSEAVGVFGDDLDGALAIGLEDPHRSGRGDAMRVQEHHDAADDLLVGPAGGDFSGADFADARNFAETFR